MTQPSPVLELRALRTEFRIRRQWRAAVRDVSLCVARNETVALVGESGSGKSVTALSILRLLPTAAARHGGGQILFEGRDLSALSEAELAHVRGNQIAMIFQDPMTSLNPTMKVGDQIVEAIRQHHDVPYADARRQALAALREVGIPGAENRIDDYPHQFSGGMRQRAMIAMALACKPALLVADEPTTALDVTIQAQILALLAQLKAAHGMSVLFITHNLGVVAQIADRVAVMYAGEIVELADVDALFARPTHPYTQALLRAMPRVDLDIDAFQGIPGQAPTLSTMPSGCAFAARCPHRQARCEHEHPDLLPVPGGARDHVARCPVALTPLRTKGETSL
ncbi:ABC transporter ATP-binding protein [Paraburkholderia sp. SUR17]|uniref:ABC transporter ATP-binding protein n=1 Tax=Paraburkholderia sp. SUR17 TaxID=3034358 RepID=UPI0024080681|nr:ABC transporter ATP-binding protein [Paraburkholderia sp. SUR17]WEY42315.1 ABC transporter ATP-binding protein [Paraburkholderia sp. SUR17]